jgi:hypothetical protein
VVEVELESDAVVEAQILGIHRVAVDDALAERDGLAIATPNKEPHSLRHHLPKSTKIIFRQLFKVQLRTSIDIEVQRVNLVDNGPDVIADM